MELLLTLLRPGTTLVGEGSAALLAAHWLRPDPRVIDLGLSRGGHAVRACALLASLGLHALAGRPRELLETLKPPNARGRRNRACRATDRAG